MTEIRTDGTQDGFTAVVVTIPANGGGAVQVPVPPSATMAFIQATEAAGESVDVEAYAGDPLAVVASEVWVVEGMRCFVLPVRSWDGAPTLNTAIGRIDLTNTTGAAPARTARVRFA